MEAAFLDPVFRGLERQLKLRGHQVRLYSISLQCVFKIPEHERLLSTSLWRCSFVQQIASGIIHPCRENLPLTAVSSSIDTLLG